MPFYSFKIVAADPPAMVIDRIGKLIRPNPSVPARAYEILTFQPVSAPFLGSVSRESFKCHRVIRYRNAFLPVINGEVSPTISGDLVRVSMRLNYFVMTFMAALLSIAPVAFIQHQSTVVDPALYTVSLLIPGIGTLALLIGFFTEAVKAKRLLQSAVAPN